MTSPTWLETWSGPEAIRIVDRMHEDTPGHLHSSLAISLKHAWQGEKEAALAAVTVDLEQAARRDDIWPLFLDKLRSDPRYIWVLEHAASVSEKSEAAALAG